MRTEQEIREAIDRTEAYPAGSYEELAGAYSALLWVVGDEDDPPPWASPSDSKT